MATGLAIPVSISVNGGAALVSGEENDRKIIATALGNGDSDNAFQQDIGLGDDMVFDVSDAKVRGLILRRLFRIFDDFTRLKRYSLRKQTIKWSTSEGQLSLEFRYQNLETDEERTIVHKFQRGGG